MKKWRVINLGDSATFVNGYAFKPSDWSTSGKEIIRIQNLTKGASQINFFNGELLEKYKVRKGDLLISWSATLGVYEWEGEDSWLNQHLFKVIFDKEELDKQFFKLIMISSLKKMEEQVHGATMKHITKKKFDAFKISLPPLETQKKIAAILNEADKIRQLNKSLIAKYDTLSQSLFLDMFGDPVTNPMNWEKVKLSDVCNKITDGTHHSPEPQNEGYPYVTAKHVKPFRLAFEEKRTFVSKGAHQEIYKRCSPEYGDVLYIKDGATTGIACINTFNEPISLLSSLALLKIKRNIINNQYLCHWLNHKGIKEKLISVFMSGAAIQRYTLSKINSFVLTVPPIGLQNKFAERIQEIEKQKANAQASLQKTEDLFNSLLQKAFKGELGKGVCI